MNKVSILDCTLRDGGYINEWAFGESTIRDIVSSLSEAGMDIIECGFLDDVIYDPNVALYSCVTQIPPIITPKKTGVLYVAMIALGDISPDRILPYDGTSIDGIRLTFHKHEWEEANTVAIQLMSKGYKVFIQPVGTTSYSDQELLKLISDVNKLQPFAFYLVDTLGIMYRQDLLRFFYLIDHNLDSNIKVGFHSHNNLQLSFANAQELMRMDSARDIIIDTSVYGMGRGVGNLSTELLAEYININVESKYVITPLLSIADNYLMSIYSEHRWGYDLPYFLSAMAKCHPNYATHLLKKSTLTIEDIAKLLSLLPMGKRDLYDAGLIEELYLSLQNCQVDDKRVLTRLREMLGGKKVLALAPGTTLNIYKREIDQYIVNDKPYIISINFLPQDFVVDMLFTTNRKRIDTLVEKISTTDCVVATSNLINDLPETVQFVNYADYLGEGKAVDNAGAMLIRVLKSVGVAHIALAGFDGFDVDASNNYCITSYKSLMERSVVDQKNEEIGTQLRRAMKGVPSKFITPTRYNV